MLTEGENDTALVSYMVLLFLMIPTGGDTFSGDCSLPLMEAGCDVSLAIGMAEPIEGHTPVVPLLP